MGTVLGYILALLVVGGLLFLAASFVFGRGEEMAPVLPEGTPVELPDDRLADGDDLRALRLSVAVRGYRMDEVDWLLDTLSRQVDTRDREIARLRSVLHVEPVPPPDDEPPLLTHPDPRRDVAGRDEPFDQEALDQETGAHDELFHQEALDREAGAHDEPFDQEAEPGPRVAYGATRVGGGSRPGEPDRGPRADSEEER